MNFSSDCAPRLKTERIRLGLKQGQVADRCGISREMWSKYERGLATPGGEVLFSFARLGANVQYILTGVGYAVLNDMEAELVESYRSSPLAVKAAVLAALTASSHPNTGSGVSIQGNVSGGQIAGHNIYNDQKK